MKLPIDELQSIWNLASAQHQGQTYPGVEEGQEMDYLSHIGGVALEVINASLRESDWDFELALKCALLHDTVEDTGLSLSLLEERYGKDVAAGVDALSKNPELADKATQMADSLGRIKQQPKAVWVVKLADRINNLETAPHHWDDRRRRRYLRESEIILKSLGSASSYLAQRLEQKMQAYQEFIE